MNQQVDRETEQKRAQFQAAKAELDELERQIQNFEALVDSRLGDLLDQLSILNADTAALSDELRNIRDRRLYGDELIRYLDGAPKPPRPLNLADLPPLGLKSRLSDQGPGTGTPMGADLKLPDIKTLYRKLARRYHPDLARTDADRVLSNEQMAEINQAYQAGDMPTLLRLAGISLPYGYETSQPALSGRFQPKVHSEEQKLDEKLIFMRQEITRLSRLPIVKLSLDVKLARHQHRDLLGEMAYDLQRKVARKTAERDYLHSQIAASGAGEIAGDDLS